LIFIVVALKWEARPLIDRYELKLDRSMTKFRVYANDGIRLILTGPGGSNAMIATVYLLTSSQAGERDFLFNIGSAGCRDQEIGRIFLASSIRRANPSAVFYPDLLLKLPLEEAELITSDTVSKMHDSALEGSDTRLTLRDMEGAYVYEAANRFIPSHQLFTIKVISDRLDPDRVTAMQIEELFSKALLEISGVIDRVALWEEFQSQEFEINEEMISDQAMIADLSDRLRLTAYQRKELALLGRMYRTRGKNPIKILQQAYDSVEEGSGIEKRERNRLYGEIRKKLSES
jgi:adenosylhomocysteine nucleosidase